MSRDKVTLNSGKIKSVALAVIKLHLLKGRQAGGQAGRQAGRRAGGLAGRQAGRRAENSIELKNLNLVTTRKYLGLY